jgi:V/A-type H+/Na+-transporting ATPase subunit G/H
MDDTLQRLLDAELRAEKIAQHADMERERIIQGAMAEARIEEERFDKRLPDLRTSFIDKAEVRADQAIAELKRRYDERHTQLRELAEQRENDALDASFAILINPGTDQAQPEHL